MEPLVSVLMPTYKHEKFIAQAIQLVVDQKTTFGIELLVGEDCSPDGTGKIARQFAEAYPQIVKVFTPPQNLGALRNEMNLYERARGKYIAFCEGDDYWTDPLKLQKQVDFLEANVSYVAAFHDASLLDEKGVITSDSKLGIRRQKDYSGEELKKGALMPTASVVFRKVIPRYPDSFLKVGNGDTFLWALLGQYGGAKYLPDIQPSVYRQHGGGMWSGSSFYKRRMAQINTFRELAIHFKNEADIAAHYRQKIGVVKRKLLLFSLKRLDFVRAWRALSV
jgi:glycosyltransferase involved in cell wall biosynthesis